MPNHEGSWVYDSHNHVLHLALTPNVNPQVASMTEMKKATVQANIDRGGRVIGIEIINPWPRAAALPEGDPLPQDILPWLKATIEDDKAAAEAADTICPGPWRNIGRDGKRGAWQIHGAPNEGGPTEESVLDWDYKWQELAQLGCRVATLNHQKDKGGGGVWKLQAANHIVLQQPRDTIARCEFELSEIARHEESHSAQGCVICVGRENAYPCDYLRRHAYAYRHRLGYRPEWAPEGMTPPPE